LPDPFRALIDLELDALGDDDLIAYIRRARDAGESQHARLGLRILVFGHMDNVERRVRMKVPEHAVDLVAGLAFEKAFTAAFDGTSVGEFRSWLNTITDRRIADYHRRTRPREEPLPSTGEDHDDRNDPTVEPETGAVEAQSAVDQAMAELNPVHQRVIDLYVFSDSEPSATDVATRVIHDTGQPMSENNVHQIARRFRLRLRELLRGDVTLREERHE
jgi:RNA polymerase sigma factor (sigma-70 family)